MAEIKRSTGIVLSSVAHWKQHLFLSSVQWIKLLKMNATNVEENPIQTENIHFILRDLMKNV